MKKKIIIGNWKMNPATPKEARDIFMPIKLAAGKFSSVQTIICPPYIYLAELIQKKGKAKIALGAQNFFQESEGSFSGEVSVGMLKNLGATHSIIGHSERRKLGETDEIVNKKLLLALKNNIVPIVCIGEVKRDEDGEYLTEITAQLTTALMEVSKNELSKIIIAYEPVWAIGAAEAMKPRQVHEMTIFIKKTLFDIYKNKAITIPPLLYGGAVDPTNAEALLRDGEAQGFLIGRQSLKPTEFSEIMRLANATR